MSESNGIKTVYHNIDPVFDKDSKILILGSFPSVKSREDMFFYAHPQNRFWRLMARLFECEAPDNADEKKTMLLKNKTAVWDVIKECDIKGSSDTSIKNVRPNNIALILDSCDINGIFCNGTKSFELYNKYLRDSVKRDAIKLPSTSPANAACSMDMLYESWKIILEYIKDRV